MVTYAPESSLVAYPGHVPSSAVSDPDFFLTPDVAALQGVAEWRTGGMFPGVTIHMPGMRVAIASNATEIDDDELLRVTVAAAREVVEPREEASTASTEPSPSGSASTATVSSQP
ncbi:hypothetical protein GCM10022402_46930 [Salinactinospora qingdaonensis]|uniref:Uncharacterized protein n=2 Tax=Salinactinospora qingdaonensis TaxID=702744 RepID=A0ABP7GFB5_9ACTN